MGILITTVCSDLSGDLASLEAIASKSSEITLTRLSDGGYVESADGALQRLSRGLAEPAWLVTAAAAAPGVGDACVRYFSMRVWMICRCALLAPERAICVPEREMYM